MSNQAIYKLKIRRVGHRYDQTRWRAGVVEVENESISRDEAERLIRARSAGRLPDFINLDDDPVRTWIWVKEYFGE